MKKSGYTILEILVVVSIIGFIASLALAFVQQVREKGRIAAILNFSDGLRGSLSDSPVSYWSFDNGDATDNWGQNHGTLAGGMNSSNIVEGVVGDALSFDGINNYVDMGNDSSLSLPVFTISAWIKTDISTNQIILGKSHISSYYINMANGKFVFRLNNVPTVSESASLNDNKWHHILVTFDGSLKKLYADGVFNTSGAGTIGYDTNNVYIGSSPSFDAEFKGSIDEVQIYGEALPFAQIQKLYAEGAKKFDLAIK